MISSRPYLLRAVHEWILDCGMTPHLLVRADQEGVDVPPSTVQDGRVVLNVSPTAVRDLLMDNELITFVARFSGVSSAITVPVDAVEAIYARENGRGMMFPEGEDLGDDGGEGDDADAGADESGSSTGKRRKPDLRVVK